MSQVCSIVQNDAPPRDIYVSPCSLPSCDEQQALVLKTLVHDARTPLTSIRGYIDLLRSETLGPISHTQQQILDRIAGAARVVTALVNDVAVITASNTEVVIPQLEHVDPIAIAQEVIETFRASACECMVALQLSSSEASIEMYSDPVRLWQILQNLVSNAIQSTEAGSVAITLTTRGEMVELRVTDTGCGIAPEELPYIWDKYYRATNRRVGSGLGLYLVRHLSELLGGTVGVTSVVGAGSSFWVYLPRVAE